MTFAELRKILKISSAEHAKAKHEIRLGKIKIEVIKHD